MKLLYDLSATQPNLSGKRHGGGRYGEVILLRMVERGLRFGCFYDSSKWLNPKIREACERGGIMLHNVYGSSVKQIISEHGYTRIYSCLPDTKLLSLTNFEVYGTVHGLRGLETPYDSIFYHYRHPAKEWFKFFVKKTLISWYRHRCFREYSRYINKTFRLITVSEHSRFAFLSFFPELKDDQMRVFYSPNTSRPKKLERNPNVTRYFLAVSGNRWEKNNLRAVMAFDRLISAGRLPQDIRMVVTGTRGDSFRYRIQNPGRFSFPGYVGDDELERLYADAFVFVYPSFNEGFGYPPIEAMRYGVPVIASPLSSMAEICAGGVLYFNPFSVEEIMNRMMMIIQPEIYNEYVRKGLEQHQRIVGRQQRDLDGVIDYITDLQPSLY